jgi:hypothetical protein
LDGRSDWRWQEQTDKRKKRVTPKKKGDLEKFQMSERRIIEKFQKVRETSSRRERRKANHRRVPKSAGNVVMT